MIIVKLISPEYKNSGKKITISVGNLEFCRPECYKELQIGGILLNFTLIIFMPETWKFNVSFNHLIGEFYPDAMLPKKASFQTAGERTAFRL